MAENGTFEKGRSRDLLSLLVRANTAKDIPASQRLSDEDVLAQVPTFLVAGHETTRCVSSFVLSARMMMESDTQHSYYMGAFRSYTEYGRAEAPAGRATLRFHR